MQIMHDRTTPQIKHILPDAPVTRSAALPMSHVCQGMLYGHALAQLGPSLRRLLAFPQLLQQGFIRMNADTASRGAGGAAVPQRTMGTGSRGKLDHSAGLKRHRLSARTAPFVPFPIQLKGPFGEIWAWAYGPGFTENGQVIGALLYQRTGQIRPVNVQFAQGALLGCQVCFDR